MTCTLDIDALALFDVHRINSISANFELEGTPDLIAACNTVGPLHFCLLPPTNRLRTMCAPTLRQYFQNVIDGKSALTLFDLPKVYDIGMYYNADDKLWIPDETIDKTKQHMGITMLPLFHSMCVSNERAMLFGVYNGQLFKTDASLGMIVRVSQVFGSSSDVYQKVILNGSGDMGVILFSYKLFLWYNNSFKLQEMFPPDFTFVNMDLFHDNTVTVVGYKAGLCCIWHLKIDTPSSNLILTHHQNFDLQESDEVLWCCLTSDRLHTVISVMNKQSSATYQVLALKTTTSANNASPEMIWTVNQNNAIRLGSWSSVCRGSLNTQTITVHAVHRNSQNAFQIILNPDESIAVNNLLNVNALEIVENVEKTIFGFKTTQDTNVFLHQNNTSISTIPLSNTGLSANDMNSTLCFEPSGTRAFILGGNSRKLFSTATSFSSTDTTWEPLDDLFLNEDIKVSDFGVQSEHSVTSATETVTWYFGRWLKNRGFVKAAYDDKYVVTSPHQTYRLAQYEVKPSTNTSFSVMSARIEKSNINAMMKQPGAHLRLYDNSNVAIFINELVVWQRNMHDSFSSETVYVETNTIPLSTFPLSSKNGLYLLFGEGKTQPRSLCVAFNVYNSAAFAEFCQNASTSETFSRAIQRQSTFCAAYLANPDATADSKSMFSDARCTCIASQEVFRRFFPNLQSDVTHPSHARLQKNLPCLLTSCQDTIATKEVTNVYNAMQQKCNQGMLTLCSTLIEKSPSATINLATSGLITQVCGANLARCTQDSQCGIGTYCVNGICTRGCDVDADCKFPSVCQNGVCVYLHTKSINSEQPLLAIIILSVILAIALIAIFIVVFLPLRKKQSYTQ